MRLPTKGWSCLITPGNKPARRRVAARPSGISLRAVCFFGTLLVGIAGPWEPRHLPAAEEVRETEVAVPLVPPLGRIRVGERLSFHGRWLGIPVGKGWIEVKSLTELNGRAVYLIEAEGRSNDFLSTFYPIHDVLRSYLDAETLRPVQVEKSQREGRYRAEEIVTFDYERLIATYRSLLNGSVKEVPVPPDVHDLMSAFYWLRLQPVDPTRSLFVNIYSDEKIYRTEIKPIKTVTLELLWRGTFPCLLIEPLASFKGVFVRRGRLWCYIGADATRLPLFIKVSTPWGLMTGVIDRDSLKVR